MSEIAPSICRNCLAFCPILVTVEDGRAVKVAGDPNAPLFEGYTCPKGRALPEQHNDPRRVLRSLKRQPDGTFAPISTEDAVAEIAAKVEALLAQHGPRSIAMYGGSGQAAHPTGGAMAAFWLRAIKSPMYFSAATIDKPAAHTSTALHGNWIAGAQSFASADVWMIVGANPVIAKSNGAPANNPGRRLKEAARRGLKLIVIDPRRTETAVRAHVHLQARPGEDPTLLAGIIHILLREDLIDRDFIANHAQGLESLKEAAALFTPDYVAARAGIAVEDLLNAARTFGRGTRGGVVCSTGPSFSTRSNLTYYLALCLNTLCGRWAREGEKAPIPNVLLPAFTPKAQPYPPYPVFGDLALRVHSLRQNASGLPTAALADEMLLPGDGQVKAFFCVGGNPALAFPDQRKTEAALKTLDLLVVTDYQMTETAKLAHYVLAAPLSLEVPGLTHTIEGLKYYGVSRGYETPWAQYTPKIVDPPPESDLLDEREFFFRLAQRMNLQLEWINAHGYGPHIESPADVIPLDMTRVPSIDELFELMCTNARVPLSEVKKYPHGHVFDEIDVMVAPRDAACTARLELGDPLMMRELAEVRAERIDRETDTFPFLLVCRRTNNFMNSVGQSLDRLTRGKPYNPAFMHPADIAGLGLAPGDTVSIRSRQSAILGVAEADPTLRRGLVSMTHGFGTVDGDDVHTGSAVARLIDMDERDPISGIPRMSALPVAVTRAESRPAL